MQSNTAAALLLAESTDGLTWGAAANKSKRQFSWPAGRFDSWPNSLFGLPDTPPLQDCWDAGGVAAGPQPERLSSGDWLYIYNIGAPPPPLHLPSPLLHVLAPGHLLQSYTELQIHSAHSPRCGRSQTHGRTRCRSAAARSAMRFSIGTTRQSSSPGLTNPCSPPPGPSSSTGRSAQTLPATDTTHSSFCVL